MLKETGSNPVHEIIEYGAIFGIRMAVLDMVRR